MTQVQENDQAVQGRWTAQLVEKSSANLWGMPFKVRKGCDSGVIFLHKPVPPHLLQATSPRGVWPRSLSVGRTDRRYQFIRSATQRPTRVVTQSKTTADMPRTLSPCSITQLQEQLLSEQQEADAITQPLLDTENGFIKGFVSLETYDPQEYEPFLLHLSRPHSFQVSTLPLKDPLSLQARARMNEKRTILRCQTGQANECQRQEEGRDGSCLQRASRVSRGTVDLATAEGRSFQPECWSSTGPS
ncbi:protein FAM228A isoform X2 [Pygocentrus nattereri]|uniref:protein FAM228A isoform X2 n=1 Tax=Pygocentrus nattereri TaxID=42514 RepID=UPI001890D6F4|nr:protein FAM228A isoform X2 [Pygocentrus nattereri]